MKKSDLDYSSAAAKIQNRVAVKKYYYETLPKDVQSLSFTVSNLETLRQVEMVKRSLANAIEKGESFESWKSNLDVSVLESLSNARLETVYRTNINNVYNQSARYNAVTSDVTPYLMYSAVGDERTRPEHMKLDGTIKRADSIFWDKYTPPLGFNCTASYQNVSGDFTKCFRSLYKGNMIRIELKSGKIIRGVTPNHPMMASVGFISAKDIKRGDKLALDNREVKGLNLSVEKNNYDLVTSSSNRFKSFFLHRFSFKKSTSFHFYNDIKSMNKEVDVVTIDGLLPRDVEIFKAPSNFILKLANNAAKFFSFSIFGKAAAIKSYATFFKNSFREGFGYSKFVGDLSSTSKFIFVEAFGFFFDLFNVFSEKFLRRNIPSRNASSMESSIDRVSTDPELTTKFQNAITRVVKFDEVVKVQVYNYFGFVYDFESIHGLVITDGVITGNCRCGVIPLSKEEAQVRGISTRSVDSFIEPEDLFGNQKMGDIKTQVSREAEKAIKELPNSTLKSKFKEAQENIRAQVDIWWQKEKHNFEKYLPEDEIE